jgi:hypothetical protein
MRNAYIILVRKSEGERSLRSLRRRWEVFIKMSLRGMGSDWIRMAWDRDRRQALVNTDSIKAGELIDYLNVLSACKGLLHE